MRRQSFWSHRFTRTRIKSEKVQLPEMLFGYILGPMGASISGSIFGSILQSYFTDVLRLDLRFLSRLQLVSTVLIVAANLLVGQLIERTRAAAGKARPWLLLSVFTFSSASVLMFIVPFQGIARIVWIAVAYNLYYSFASPIYSTASSIMLSVSTRDSRQRGLLASINSMVGLGVMGTCSMVFPMLVSFFLRENIHRWFFTMLGVAVFTGLTIYLQFAFTRERVTEERRILEGLYGPEDEFEAARQAQEAPPEPAPVQQVSLRRQLRAVAADPMWWLILGVCVLFQWSGSLKNSTMTYYCKWVVDNTFLGSAGAWGASQSLLTMMGALPMALASVLLVPLTDRFGKRKVCGWFLLLGAAGGVIAGLGQGRLIPVAIGVALKCFGSAPTCCLLLAMVTDVVDHVEMRSGIRTDGLTMSVYSSQSVAGGSVMSALFNGVLARTGYDQCASTALGTAAQNAAVRHVIAGGYIWVETLSYVAAGLLLLAFWKVEKDLAARQKNCPKTTSATKNRTLYRPKRPILPELRSALCFALRPTPGCGILMFVILKPGYGVPGHQRGNER